MAVLLPFIPTSLAYVLKTNGQFDLYKIISIIKLEYLN